MLGLTLLSGKYKVVYRPSNSKSYIYSIDEKHYFKKLENQN